MSERGAIQTGGRVIEYTVTRSRRRRKTVAVTVEPGGAVRVAAPVAVPFARIHEIVGKRAAWIVRRLEAAPVQPHQHEFVSGEVLFYLGCRVDLVVEQQAVKRVTVRSVGPRVHVSVPAGLDGEARRAAVERALTRWYRRRAGEVLAERVQRWSAALGVTPAAVLVRNQRRRWGSCAPDGTLRFNWRIVMAPLPLVDYLVVHELAHLRERNHGPAFWSEVARALPDHKQRRAELRALEPALNL